MPVPELVGSRGCRPLNWTAQLLKETPGALILHWAKRPQALWLSSSCPGKEIRLLV